MNVLVNFSIICNIYDEGGIWSSLFLSLFSTGDDEGSDLTSTLLILIYNKYLK